MRRLSLAVVAWLLPLGGAACSNKDAVAANAQEASQPAPLYSQQDDDTYMYVAALTPDEQKQGKEAAVYNVRFVGSDGSFNRIESVDDNGVRLATYECSNPCNVMKEIFLDGSFRRSAVAAGSIIESAFIDSFNGFMTQAKATEAQMSITKPTEPTSTESQVSQDVASSNVAPIITDDFSLYRTRISEGWDTGPTFGNRYVMITFGCGTFCTFNIVGDHKTGRLYDLGLGGEGNYGLNLHFNNQSNRIKARWEDIEHEACIEQNYLWTGTELKEVGAASITPRADSCPTLT